MTTEAPGTDARPARSAAPHVALFATCITDTMKPSVPIATVKLLERLGCRVSFPMKQLFKIYSHTILPVYGKLISKDKGAYQYLTASIEAFPQGEQMVGILKKAGFSQASFRRLTFGICTMYYAQK